MELEQDVIETPEVEEVRDAEELQQEGQDTEAGEPEDAGLVVEVGGEEEEPVGAPEWVRELRRANREKDKELRELRARLAGDAPKEDVLPPKPKAEDFDYDSEAHADAVEKWTLLKVSLEAKQVEARKAQEEIDQIWQSKVARYDEGKAKLGAPDYEDAEALVHEIMAKPFIGVALEDARLNVIKNVAKDPNAVVYALGKNEAKAKELAEINDVTVFAHAVGMLEAKMTIVRGGSKPAPEKKIGGTVAGVGAMDNVLERLRAEAEKTGDYSKVVAYKRANRA
jgi:hypothetical protein